MTKLLFATLVAAASVAGCARENDLDIAGDHPRIYLAAGSEARARLAADLAAGQPEATRFRAVADRWVEDQDEWGFEAWHAALLGQLTGDPKYCAAAIKSIDAQVKAAESSARDGGEPEVAYDDYLYIGALIGDLALVYDWCTSQIPHERARRWMIYAYQSVWNVWNADAASWAGKSRPWEGWATDNPSNNYHYSFLRATMLLSLAAHGEFLDLDEWLADFRDRHLEQEVFPTFNADLAGGGSREGTGYGVSQRRLFELYDVWQATTGERIADRTPHTRASMLAMMHQIVPTLDRIPPTGDHSRDSKAELYDFHRNYLQILISLYPNDPVSGRAQTLLAASARPQMGDRFMFVYDFLYPNRGVAPTALDGLGTAYYAPGIGQLYARSGWDKSATWVNLTAGPYTESHAHQDQGALMIYKDGWLAYDANVESDGLQQGLDAPSLVRIVDGGRAVEQRDGTTSKLLALHRGAGWLHAAADLTPAYKGQAAVQKVQREIIFLEPDAVVVYDRVTTRAGGQQVWQLAAPVAPQVSGARATITGTRTLTVQRVAPAQATSAVTNLKSSGGGFTGGFRLDTTMPGGDQRYLHVLSIGNAVSSVTPGTDGATLQLAGGRAVAVQFSRDGVGGTLAFDGTPTQLLPGVDTLPE